MAALPQITASTPVPARPELCWSYDGNSLSTKRLQTPKKAKKS
jgi:hypothetical protein